MARDALRSEWLRSTIDMRLLPAQLNASEATEMRVDLKRASDLLISIALLIFLSPLLIILLLLIRLDGGPAFFAHKRLGKGGRVFPCLKLRSMHLDADVRLAELLARDEAARMEWEESQKLKNDPRVTWIGAFLRRSSLDEVPQLFNVLIGDMSIVGPRPIINDEIKRYGHYIKDYYSVRPGITGLWQVSGRSDTSYQQRVAMDVLYSRNVSMALDMKILLDTIPAVLFARGSY